MISSKRSIWVCAVAANDTFKVVAGKVDAVVPNSPDMLLLYSNLSFSIYLVGKIRDAEEIELEVDIVPSKDNTRVVIPDNIKPIVGVRVAPCHRI